MPKHLFKVVTLLLVGCLLADSATATPYCPSSKPYALSMTSRQVVSTEAFSPRPTLFLFEGNYIRDFWKKALNMLNRFVSTRIVAEPKPDGPSWLKPKQVEGIQNLVGGQKSFDYLLRIRALVKSHIKRSESVALYIASGADVVTVLLASDADHIVMVDDLPYRSRAAPIGRDGQDNYLSAKAIQGGVASGGVIRGHGQVGDFIERELESLAAHDVRAVQRPDHPNVWDIYFKWENRDRHIVFIGRTDAHDVDTYAPYVQELGGADFFISKGGEFPESPDSQTLIDRITAILVNASGILVLDSRAVLPSSQSPVILIDDPELSKLEKVGASFGYTSDARTDQSGAVLYEKLSQTSLSLPKELYRRDALQVTVLPNFESSERLKSLVVEARKSYGTIPRLIPVIKGKLEAFKSVMFDSNLEPQADVRVWSLPTLGTIAIAEAGEFVWAEIIENESVQAIFSAEHYVCTPLMIRAIGKDAKTFIGHHHLFPNGWEGDLSKTAGIAYERLVQTLEFLKRKDFEGRRRSFPGFMPFVVPQ